MSLGTIIYNLLYSRRDKRFEINDLIEELHKRNVDVSFEKVLEEVNHLIQVGHVSQRVGYFVSYI